MALSSAGPNLEMTWIEPRDGTPRVLHAAMSDGAWTTPSVVAEGDTLFVNWADTPVLGRAGDGSSIVTYPRKSGAGKYAYDVVVSRLVQGNWEDLGSPHRDGTESEHGFPSLVADGSGFRIFWLDGRMTTEEGPMTLRTARWEGAFEGSRVIDSRVCDCCGTDAIREGQDWAVVYRDRSDSEVRDIRIVQSDGTGSALANDGWQIAGCPVNGPRIVALPLGRVAAWATGASGLEVRASFGGVAGVVAPAEDSPAGRVDLVVVEREAIITWLGSDGVYARRLAPTKQGLRAGLPVKIAGTGPGRSTGFPRAAVVRGELWTIWTGASGLVGERIPLASVPPVSDRLPAPTTRAPESNWDLSALALKSLDGAPGSLRLRGPRTLVTTWASWCGPCRKELEVLREVHRGHPELDLQVVAVADTAASIARAAPEPPGTWWLAERSVVRESLGTDAVPRTWLIDSAGRALWSHEGALDAETLEQALRTL